MNNKQQESQSNERFRLFDGTEARMSVKPIFAFSGGVEDEPIGLTIVPSGWPEQFHVIVEYGDSDNWDNHFMNKAQILQKFGVEVPDMNLKNMARNEGNDQSFGRSIRSTIL